ncbi:MAG: hypothetical protein H6R10_3348 [Rhodocyclaceae bacterium]|nr:hypothetical protein [Rhodocyclaceae bacterium]
MRRLILALWLGLAGLPWAAAEPQSFLQPSFGDFRDELRQARSEGKKGLILVFEMEVCPYCKRFHEKILDRPRVVESFQRDFNAIRVDVQGATPVQDFSGRAMSESQFARDLKVRGTPTTIAFDLEGREAARLAGVPVDAQEFLLWREYVLSGAAGRMGFGQYRSERR